WVAPPLPPERPPVELAAGLRGDVVAEVVGLGGLGSSGYGRGGGPFGALGEYARAEVATGEPVVLGSIDRNLIQRVIRRYLNQIRYCYERELTRSPGLQGKVVVRFVIAANGAVAASEVRTSTLGSPEVEACVAGRFLRMEFAPIPGGGQVVVNYPFVFANPSGDAAGGFEEVREYAAPDYRGAPPPAVRSDFRSTVAWAPRVRTSVDGPVPVRVVTSDAVTTFRVTAEGLAGAAVGRTEVELASTRPFSLDVPLPVEVSFGDRLLVPVRLTNTRGDALDVELLASFGAPLAAEDGTGAQQLHLAPRERATTWIPVEVPAVRGAASVSVTASAGGLSDGIERTLTVAPRGFPAGWTASGALDDRASERFTVDGALPGSVSAELVLYPSRLSELADGVAAMLAMPHGCFEQTSSTNYPNVLALQLLTKEGRGAALARTHADALAAGYRQLTGYQVARGGFETFGDGPGKEALSAFGLLQFHDMAQVFPNVDPQMVARDVAFLLAARDGRGGYTATGSSSHAYGSAPADLNDAYITYALARTGHLDAGAPEVRRQAALARTATDPYRLALAVLTLAAVDPERGGDAADRLAEFQ
ncbi:MAG: AgmX/PglI C-terminal domain-containing protein, partial [Myxococcota bacterium]